MRRAIRLLPLTVAVALVPALGACTSAGKDAEHSAPEPTPVESAGLPALDSGTTPEAPPPEPNYEPTFQDRVEVTGLYSVSPVRGGKRLQAGSLLVDGETEAWILSYRPQPDYFEFVDKRVVVTGRPYTNSPYVQSVGGTHFEVESIELAPGETPYDPKPSRLPGPPRVRNEAEIEARVGRWAHIVGRLGVKKADEGEIWVDGHLDVDGTKLRLPVNGQQSRLRPLDGKQVTVLARIRREGAKLFLYVGKACPGVVDECEVDRDE